MGAILLGPLVLIHEMYFQRWKAMVEVDQLIMIIPVVLNLKGNLEMNLSARLGTAANMGQLDEPDMRNKIIRGNLALLQVQATVVSFIAACVSLILGLIVPRAPDAQSPSSPSALLARRPIPTLPHATERKSGLPVYVGTGTFYNTPLIYFALDSPWWPQQPCLLRVFQV